MRNGDAPCTAIDDSIHAANHTRIYPHSYDGMDIGAYVLVSPELGKA
ncbi:hypothetical protein [Kingella kingae]|nr:hypothetical protein [Kingella kingae]